MVTTQISTPQLTRATAMTSPNNPAVNHDNENNNNASQLISDQLYVRSLTYSHTMLATKPQIVTAQEKRGVILDLLDTYIDDPDKEDTQPHLHGTSALDCVSLSYLSPPG